MWSIFIMSGIIREKGMPYCFLHGTKTAREMARFDVANGLGAAQVLRPRGRLRGVDPASLDEVRGRKNHHEYVAAKN
jgi:hypothetical protein